MGMEGGNSSMGAKVSLRTHALVSSAKRTSWASEKHVFCSHKANIGSSIATAASTAMTDGQLLR
jgi:hypothetical protein